MKMKGAEWNSFFNDPTVWDRDVWHDNLIITVNGKKILERNSLFEDDDDFVDVDSKATVIIESGDIYFGDDSKPSSIKSVIRKWRRNQKFKTICVEIPNEMFYAVCEQLKKDGCKIIK